MRLKEIDIKGFKSFSNRTRVEFQNGITAIVGPNGSGKSNISDAIRWVLGEQSIKTLRGSKMEDVIFAGTNDKKPLGFAEVTITFDNSSGLIPIEYKEVAITRRVFRSGESEFFINKNACRLRDIKELLMDTGIGKEGYSIIGQGRIDEILSNNSQERRGIFEEAAGIIKYKSKKEESLRKLNRTDENLIRIDDLLSELKSQEANLKRQANKAEKYKEIYSMLKELEINVLLDSIINSEEKYKFLKDNDEILRKKLDEIKNTYGKLEGEINSLEREMEGKSGFLEENTRKCMEATRRVEEEKNNLKILLEKKKYNEKDLDRLKLEKTKLSAEIEKLELEYIENNKLLKSKLLELEALKGKFSFENQEINEIIVNIKNLQEFIEKSKDETIEIYNKISDKKSELNSINSLSKNMDERLSQLKKYIVEEEEKLENLSKKSQRIGLERESKEIELDKKLGNMAIMDEETAELEANLTRVNSDINNLNIEIERNISSYNLLKKMEESYEGYYKGVKNVLKASEEDSGLKNSILGVVADLIRVRQDFELAINTSLGSSSQFIVTRDQPAAKYIIDYLYRTRSGRVTCLPLNVIKGKAISINEADRKNYRVLGLASELVEFDEKYRNIVENLLGRTIVVEDMDQAIKLSNKYKNTLRIVTLKGNLINPGGSMTGGSQNQSSINILSRKNQIDRIIEDIKAGKSKRKISLENREDLLNRINNSRIIYKNSLEETKSLEMELIGVKNRFEQTEEDKSRLNLVLEGYQREIDSLKTGNLQYDEKKNSLKAEIERLEKYLLDLKETIGNKALELENLTEFRDSNIEKVTEKKIEISREENTIDHLKNKIEEDRLGIEAIGFNLDKNFELSKLSLKNIEDSKTGIEKTEAKIKELELELEGLNRLVEASKLEIKFLEERLQEKDGEKKDKFEVMESLKEKLNKLEVGKVREEMILKSFLDDLEDKYEISYSEALEHKDEKIDLEESRPKIREYRSRIEKLGNVNLNSIDEYRLLKERLDFIEEQREDMLEAKKDLEKVIAKMENTMKTMFRESFELINKNFKLIFKTLFNGGEANLFLEDENDLLNSGIDILAKPPGKKLQNLSSLSGGERSLVAVALLFAILKIKPSPFCILDEIDAALDEANIGRYTSYLKDIGEATQFIIITHRKRTMEMADVLYGVTMEEEGVSKLISVELKDYEEAVS